MARQRFGAGALIGGLMAGGLAAGGAALLFAPKAGNVTRRLVREKSARYLRNARARFSRSKAAK